jgi:hypothetical protein
MNLFGWFFYCYEKRFFLIAQVSTIQCHAAVFTEVCLNESFFNFPSGTFPKIWEVVIPFPIRVRPTLLSRELDQSPGNESKDDQNRDQEHESIPVSCTIGIGSHTSPSSVQVWSPRRALAH